MGRPPGELTPSESALHFFGAELRHWRMLRELSQNGLGQRSHDSGSLISKVEKAERFPSRGLARRLDEILATGGVLERLWWQAERERADRVATARPPAATPEPLPADLGLVWCVDTAATVEVVGALWRADMERRSVLLSAAWVAAACAEPLREWLLDRRDEVLSDRPGRAVSQVDVDALWKMCEAFNDADQRLGGGYARATLLHYVNDVVFPLLRGSYSEAIGRELMAAAGQLCHLCGFTSFDSGRQGLAQRYYIQALRLAQSSGNRALGARILANMSKQAHYLRNPSQALELATAGYRTALDCGSPSTVAKCASQLGRAHALYGDQRACAQACTVAERMLDRPTTERTRFTADHMLGEQLYMADELGCARDVQRIAPEALTSSPGGARRYVQYTTVLAASYLLTAGNLSSDIDRACELLGQVLPSLGALHSTRCMERFNAVRRALAAHADRPCVQEFEDRFRGTITAA